jgi:nucleoside-diphosphate-sugar epimerase
VKVLVTGGTGYLGAAIVRALAARGHQVVCFSRHAAASRLPAGVIAADGDVRDRASLEGAARGVDAICHTAALVSIWRRDRAEFDAVNVGGLEHVLSILRAQRLSRVVYTSSFLALPPAGSTSPIAGNDYQRTKVAADRIARRAIEDGLPIAALYPGVVYGPGTQTEGNLVGRLVSDHRARRLPGLLGPERTWSFAYVDDVAAAHAEAVERSDVTGRYELGGENAPQIRPFEIARDRLGLALPRRIPPALARVAGALDEARARLTGRPPLLTRGTVDILTRDWPLGHARASAELGYRVTPLDLGIERLLATSFP